MNQQESKATKYDWSNVPDWINWVGTDALGRVLGFANKPSEICIMHADYCLDHECKGFGHAEHIEHRPSPCAQCPHRDDVCCQGVR